MKNAAAIRRRLLLTTLLPLVAALLVSWLVGVRLIADRIEGQARTKVRSDLSAAQEIYDGELANLAHRARQLALIPELGRAVQRLSRTDLERILTMAASGFPSSFVSVVDQAGLVRYRLNNPTYTGDSLQHFAPVQVALRGTSAQGTLLLTSQQAQREHPALAASMAIPLQASPHVEADSRSSEQRGLFMVAAAPLHDANGRLLGAVCIGQLLNNNQALVERITRITSPGQATEDGLQQNATLFLHDVRIATTVTDENGQRAIGTRMSAAVASQVLEKGELWHDRAFVLNQRYFAAYQPLRDPDGAIVGALYVGVPEQPFITLRRTLNLTFAGLLLAMTTLGLLLTSRLARQLAQREAEIQAFNRTLEDKVQQRTIELEEKNHQLLRAEKELARSERLAELGMLSAGVAHEINNPLAIIRGNAELLQMELPQQQDSQEEVREILTQVGRINRIVGSLLTLARQERRQISRFPLNPLLDEILDQIDHQIPLEGYSIERSYREQNLQLLADREQLRQVFTNLILNGLQAMEGGGRLTISAGTSQGMQVITVTDSGHGITPEQQQRLFTPFYSTKQHGTGLGLAVSWGIVRNHGGSIEVHSVPGQGSGFAVRLPLVD
ncbi:sensor histidine kinase [Trichlorobacter sp.]|uniref:sensor histidine kinase n=1 Tax=Trichlorobacter sp. TaxID=2911007 RepID=UPI002A367A6A|nr:cache domain-containing protein [Trichlorobacter sp.]MDY0384194.1 cache domain-containing protein [Trichlorobacter sp.]